MKQRTRRRIGAWTRTPLAVIGGILTIVGFITPGVIALFGSNARSWTLLVIIAILLSSIGVYLVRKRDAAAELAFFRHLTFQELTDDQRKEIVVRLAQGGSATPEFSMVAPAPDELSIVLDHLAFEQAAYITGGPGEGKSTLAFHAAREFFETGYNVYQLSVLSLNGYSREFFAISFLPKRISFMEMRD